MKRRQRGVNLVELSISLAVMAIVATGILVPLVTQIEQRNVLSTEATISDIKDALLGYAAVNGRLPCPATAASGGVEDFAGGGSAANGDCESFSGFVPGRTLGVTPVDSSGYVVDPWNNRIRYAVSGAAFGIPPIPPNPQTTRPFTRTDGLRIATMTAIAYATGLQPQTQLLQVCASGTGVTAGAACYSPVSPLPTPITNELTSTAAAVIWSPGANAVTTGGTGTDEAQNPNPRNEASTDALFVSRARSDDAANPFDDIVSWISVSTLVNRMVAAGQLP